jgi:hypothetical protein
MLRRAGHVIRLRAVLREAAHDELSTSCDRHSAEQIVKGGRQEAHAT